MAASTPQAFANWKEKQKMTESTTSSTTPGVGHNSGELPDEEAPKTRFAKDQLKSFVERVERLEEEKKAISDDIRDVIAEAKGNGFDAKALRAIIRERKIDPAERREQEAIQDTYRAALGMLA